MSTNRGHRAGQCAPEVPRTGIRARGDLQERRTRPGSISICHPIPAARLDSSLILHLIPAPRQGDSLIQHLIPAPQPGDSHIQQLIPAPRPCNSLIWRRYGGGVGNRCRWAKDLRLFEQQPYVAARSSRSSIWKHRND